MKFKLQNLFLAYLSYILNYESINPTICICMNVCRDLVMSIKGPDAPIVIVGNKTDAERVISKVIIYMYLTLHRTNDHLYFCINPYYI